MNLAESAGLSACASAPETISALTAAQNIRVLIIMASSRICSPLFGNNSREKPTFPAFGTCARLMGEMQALRALERSVARRSALKGIGRRGGWPERENAT